MPRFDPIAQIYEVDRRRVRKDVCCGTMDAFVTNREHKSYRRLDTWS